MSGKAKPNTQHLNPSESALSSSHCFLLGFLGSIVGFPSFNRNYGNSIPINKGAEVKIIRYVA
jgi:hypothetical protein